MRLPFLSPPYTPYPCVHDETGTSKEDFVKEIKYHDWNFFILTFFWIRPKKHNLRGENDPFSKDFLNLSSLASFYSYEVMLDNLDF